MFATALALIAQVTPEPEQRAKALAAYGASIGGAFAIGRTRFYRRNVRPSRWLDYDADGDVLYVHVGPPRPAEGEETPEGHVLRFDPGTQRIVGLTLINARHVLDRDGRLIVTVPETVEASADELAPALQAV